MSFPLKENSKGRNLQSQNKYLQIVLWLFPFFLLNVGWYFLGFIDRYWENQNIEELAQQEVESLSSASDFSHRLTVIGIDFFKRLQAGADSFSEPSQRQNFLTYVKSRAEYEFRKPFPEHELFVFQIPKGNGRPSIIYTNRSNITGKRALELSFEYLARVNAGDNSYSGQDRKKGLKIAESIIVGEIKPDFVAETQRGKASFTIYKLKGSIFFWDYFKNDKTGDIFGCFIFIENNNSVQVAGKLLALRELKDSVFVSGANKSKYGAFIPLFPGYGGVVASEELENMPGFSQAVRKWVPSNISELTNWKKYGQPDESEDIGFGDLKAYFHIGTNQSHAAVLLLPVSKSVEMPKWLFIADIFVVTFVLLMLLRGFLLGIWPQTSLKIRFITTYLLAACLPLGMLVIISYAYISEYKYSLLSKMQSQLKFCINQFDSRKIKTQGEYRATFKSIFENEDVKRLFREYEKRQNKGFYTPMLEAQKFSDSVIKPEGERVLDSILNILDKEGRKLPIMYMAVLDEFGGYIANIGNEKFQYCCLPNQRICINKKKNLSDRERKKFEGATFSLGGFLSPVLTTLRNKISSTAPNEKKWGDEFKLDTLQHLSSSLFKTFFNSVVDFNSEVDKNSGFVITRFVDNRVLGQIYDYIFIDEVPRYILVLVWDEGDLDEENFQSTLNYFAINEPNFVFSAFNTDSNNVSLWKSTGRHGRDFERISQIQASRAFLGNRSLTFSDEKMSVVAVPSRKYPGKIIVGGVSHYYVEMPIFIRIGVCSTIIVLSLLILFFSLYYSSKTFLRPISKLKEYLDRVANGELDIGIKNDSQDEFGLICREFAFMTKGLKERNKLATLISDHAVEALSRKDLEEGSYDVETFNGTALVSDIRNFTGMCEKQVPDQITDLLNEHFARMTKIISENGGRIYKYIGDAIEVVFADKDNLGETSVERALNAAYEMIKCLERINRERRDRGLFTYKIGVGLSYGVMSSGTIGSLDTRLDYAIIGDTLKNAAKLEGLSKHIPEFPLVVDSNFVSVFNSVVKNIEFENLESFSDKNAFCLTKSGMETFIAAKSDEVATERSVVLESLKDGSSEKEVYESSEISKKFSFGSVFLFGLIFISLFGTIVLGGSYFLYKSLNENEKVNYSLVNQRMLEQIISDQTSKTAFDIKARQIAAEIDEKIESSKENEITNEFIEAALNSAYKKDKNIQDMGFNKIFFKVEDWPDLVEASDEKFIDRIKLLPLANTGYTKDEIKSMYDTFKIYLALTSLEESKKAKTNKNKLLKIEDDEVSTRFKLYIKDNYGEPSVKLFGSRCTMEYMVYGKNFNLSISVFFRDEDTYLFMIDIFKAEKLVGFFVCSVPYKEVNRSLPFILNAYSNEGFMLSVKESFSKKIFFSENVPEYMKKGAIAADPLLEDYFKSLPLVVNKGDFNLGDTDYDLYLMKPYEHSDFWSYYAITFILIIIPITILILWKIANGETFISRSFAPKLWIALTLVAVIPVLTVFFVFALFKNEHYSVRIASERAEIQKYSKFFENKMAFSRPLLWNYAKNKNFSQELSYLTNILNDKNKSKDTREKALAELRKLVLGWKSELQQFSTVGDGAILSNFEVTDISVSGKGGWEFSCLDKEDKLERESMNTSLLTNSSSEEPLRETVSYVTEEDDKAEKFMGILFRFISNNILSRRVEFKTVPGKIDKEKLTVAMGLDVILRVAEAYLGTDSLIAMANSIDTPVVTDLGVGEIGYLSNPVPDYDKPEFIVSWVVGFTKYIELLKRSYVLDKKAKYRVFPTTETSYGMIAMNMNNKWRIVLGKLAGWISASRLPISTAIKIDDDLKLIEGGNTFRSSFSMMLLSGSTTSIDNDIYGMSIAFYSLLTVSLLLIVGTTRNIANDIINPIMLLIAGVREVNRENFAYRISSSRTDELGALCLSFDMLIKGLDEKRKIGRMISKTAQMITLKEGADMSIKTQCVLLYVGIPDFSSWLFGLRDYEVFSDLKRHTAAIAGIIMEEGGEVDKIMGEKLLAVFSVNKREEEKDSLLSACRVAKRIIGLENSSKLPFPISIGINYGSVINGFLGVGNKRDFTVIGDAVNVTARIESLAEKLRFNRIIVSEFVYELISKDFSAKPYGEVELKGKAKPMKVYQLT